MWRLARNLSQPSYDFWRLFLDLGGFELQVSCDEPTDLNLGYIQMTSEWTQSHSRPTRVASDMPLITSEN